MTIVTRYRGRTGDDIIEDISGDLVFYTDYIILQQERDQLKEQLAKVTQHQELHDRIIARQKLLYEQLQQAAQEAAKALKPLADRAGYFDRCLKANGGHWQDDDVYCDDPPTDIYLKQLQDTRQALTALEQAGVMP